ncbi:hypothetical protein Tco_0460889 [Tanacetum coccineum]
MSKLAFCDYHNMVAILEKTEHNTDFHQIVDFLEASPLRYALLVRPTIYVSHIRQFWSTARIETADGETHIIAKINGKQVTVSESSIRRKLKLKDEEGISDLPDTDLFANLSRMGYNILPNQRFSFQKGQFTHQWKFLIHTIMQCLSPKSTAFNEFSSNIATAIVCLATNKIYNFSKMIFDGMITNIKRQGSKKFLMYPRFLGKLLKMSQFGEIKHTETYLVLSQTAKVFTTLRVNSPSFSGRNVDLFESMLVPQGEGPPASPPRDDSHREAFPTATSLDAGQDMENIPKTSAMPHESSPRVTSLGGDEGSLQLKLNELIDFCTKLQSQHSQMACKIQREDFGIERDSNKSTDKGSESTGEMRMLAATASEKDSTAAVITTTTAVTPYTRRTRASRGVVMTSSSPIPINIPSISKEDKGKGIMTEPAKPTKQKVQEQMSEQLARELEEEFAQENQRLREQAARDAEIARLHTEGELKMMIDELDRSNEVIAKHLKEYAQAKDVLSLEDKIELITELAKYQKDLAQIKKYQAQQSKLASKTDRRKFYTSVLRSHAGWKTKDFKGMTFEQIEETFIPV